MVTNRLLSGAVMATVLAVSLMACETTTPIPDERTASVDPRAQMKTDLGIEYMREGANTVALTRLLEALQVDPDYVRAHAALGLAYFRSGDSLGGQTVTIGHREWSTAFSV